MRKMMMSVMALFAIVFASCSHKTLSTSLAGEWDIVAVNGNAMDTALVEETPYIGFNYDESRVYGMAGCNRFFAEFALDTVATTLSFAHSGATRMMCFNMEVEDQILSSLENVANYKVMKEGEVELCNAAGETLLQLRKK